MTNPFRALANLFAFAVKEICPRHFSKLNPNPQFGVLNWALGQKFLKVELKSGALSPELQRRDEMPIEVRGLFCPLTVKEFIGVRVAILPRGSLVRDDEKLIAHAQEFLAKMKNFGRMERVHVEDFPEVREGLAVLGHYAEADLIYAVRTQLDALFAEPVAVGPVHGDFHRDNIVTIKSSGPMLIDADCFRPRGFQLFDLIYFSFEAAQREFTPPRGWLEELSNALEEKSRFPVWLAKLGGLSEVPVSPALALYFVERLSQDHRYVERLTEKDAQWTKRIASIFKSQAKAS